STLSRNSLTRGRTVAAVSPIAAALNAPSPSASATPSSGTSGQTLDFMKLLMAQMQNQNPMEPQSGTEYMTQIAQFSQLDGINKLNTSLANMMLMQGLTQGTNLIGKKVTFAKDATGATATGVVQSVAVNGGK